MALKWFCFLLTLILATPALSQPNLNPSAVPAPVLVRFHVELGDQLVTTLTKGDFILLEDGRLQSITAFWGAQPDSFSGVGPVRRPKPLVDMIFLLDSTAASGSVADPRGPVTELLGIGALERMVTDPHQEIRVAVYGFGSHLKRFCGPTHDANTLSGAFAGAMGAHYRPQNEIQRRPSDVDPGPLPSNWDVLPSLRASPAIPAPGKIIPLSSLGAGGRRLPHESLSWDEALIATAQDVAREPSNATRMIVPLLAGLPQPGSDPEAVAKAYQELGVALYPRVTVRAWILSEEWVLRHGGREPPAPTGIGLDWNSLAAPQKLALLNEEDSLTKRYEALGEQTGGMPFLLTTRYRSIAEMLADEASSVYITEFVPPNSGAGLRHKIEIHLRDNALGKVVGGIRLTQ
jgi:hypothetical protein